MANREDWADRADMADMADRNDTADMAARADMADKADMANLKLSPHSLTGPLAQLQGDAIASKMSN